MYYHAFPDAVHEAIGAGIPCLRPFFGIDLLHIIEEGELRPLGTSLRRCCRQSSKWCCVWPPESDVLESLGILQNTLIKRTTEVDIITKLTELVKDAQEGRSAGLAALTSEHFSSVNASFKAHFPVDLGSLNLKATRSRHWKLSFGDGKITKRSVDYAQVADCVRATRDLDLSPNSRVVTAIYSIEGGLQYRAYTTAVAIGKVVFGPTSAPVSLGGGWQYTVTTTQEIIVTQSDPVNWIIAIECRKPADFERGRLRPINATEVPPPT